MRSDAITKLYDGLSLKEKAALAFNYSVPAALGDIESEREECRIKDRVSRGEFFDFLSWVDRFGNMAVSFSVLHWQLQSLHWQSKWAVLACLNASQHLSEAQENMDMAIEAEAKLLALDGALETVCVAHGINPTAIRRLADTEPFKGLASTKPDSAYQASMHAQLSSLI